jgi:tellurite resistance protein
MSDVESAVLTPKALIMDLFEDAFEGFSEKKDFGPHEGVAGVLLGASACDGHVDEQEVQSLMLALGRMKLYQHVNERKFGSMMDRLVGMLKRGGPEKLLAKAAAAVPPELAETVFANACNIVLADGVVEDDEKEFLNEITRKLDIAADRAKKIVKVMVIKNRG